MKTVYLPKGESKTYTEHVLVETKSDLSTVVIVWDQARRYGGVCNIPFNIQSEFGDLEDSLLKILRDFKKNGSLARNIQVKLVASFGSEESISKASEKFYAIILESIYRLKIPVAAQSKKKEERLVRFWTSEGRVQIKNNDELYEKSEKINVLIVDDSNSVRLIIKNALKSSPQIKVCGEANDPIEAKEFIKKFKPDVITLDVNMPRMDGITFLKKHLRFNPIPTIIVTGLNENDLSDTLDALENGAFHYIKKPKNHRDEIFVSEINQSVLAAAAYGKRKEEVKVMQLLVSKISQQFNRSRLCQSLVVIGASTGGTQAIQQLLYSFTEIIPPIVIVIHIPAEFSREYAERLNQTCPFRVKEATNGEMLEENTAYIAPGGKHTKLLQLGDKVVLRITDDPPVNKFRPSVDYLFKSVLLIQRSRIVPVLLTGMGVDGAKGMYDLKQAGHHTIAQNESSSIVFGMPKAAIEMGGASDIVALQRIPTLICDLVNK